MTPVHRTPLFLDTPLHHVAHEPTQTTLLMAELQLALGYLEKRQLQDSARSRSIRRHARQSYDEAVRLLAAHSFSDKNRHHLEAQAAISKERLIGLGEKF